MKYLIIVGDGMVDERMPRSGGKSPLEVADIPTINRLARQGVVGHAQNLPAGLLRRQRHCASVDPWL